MRYPQLRLTLQDAGGRVIFRRRYRSHSWVEAYLKNLRLLFRRATESGTRDITNTLRTIGYLTSNPPVMAVASNTEGDTNMGIVVGTGTTPVAVGDYKLEAQIAHGNGAGQLFHLAMAYDDAGLVQGSGGNRYFRMQRAFNNGSGGGITVNETGIYCRSPVGTSTYYFCLARDVLPAGVLVQDAQTLTLTYEMPYNL